MSEPLNLERALQIDYGPNSEWKNSPLAFLCRRLLADVDRLRDEIADRANVEADLRAQLDQLARYIVERCGDAWQEGYGQGRDDEADNLDLRPNPYPYAVGPP